MNVQYEVRDNDVHYELQIMTLLAGCIGALSTTAMTVLQAELRRINLIQVPACVAASARVAASPTLTSVSRFHRLC